MLIGRPEEPGTQVLPSRLVTEPPVQAWQVAVPEIESVLAGQRERPARAAHPLGQLKLVAIVGVVKKTRRLAPLPQP